MVDKYYITRVSEDYTKIIAKYQYGFAHRLSDYKSVYGF